MKPENKNNKPEFYVDISRASPEACQKILEALNAELDSAVAQKRFPSLERAFRRMEFQPASMM